MLASALCLAFELLVTDLKIGASGKRETDSKVQNLIKQHGAGCGLKQEGREQWPLCPASPRHNLFGKPSPGAIPRTQLGDPQGKVSPISVPAPFPCSA